MPTLAYVEGWHVIAEANRIFGFDAWDRQTLSTRCVWSASEPANIMSPPISRRCALRAGRRHNYYYGRGPGRGSAKPLRPDEAHELALKGAETDATKRALATFGNPFGLALYDREQVASAKSRRKLRRLTRTVDPARGLPVPMASFEKPSEFAAALQTR